MMTMARKVDPVTLTVIWNSLVSIADEMGGALRRTAFSEAVREGEDFSTGLFDRQTRLVARACARYGRSGFWTAGQLTGAKTTLSPDHPHPEPGNH